MYPEMSVQRKYLLCVVGETMIAVHSDTQASIPVIWTAHVIANEVVALFPAMQG